MHITEPLPNDKRARLVFGLDWSAYPIKGARAERRRYADDFGATHFVELKVAGEMIGGFAAPDTSEARGARLYAGAARVALHDRIKGRPAALVLLQDEQVVHLVFVVRGAVRSDEVLSLEEARGRQHDIKKECLRTNLQLTTFGSGPSIGDVDEVFRPEELLGAKKLGRIAKLPISVPTLVPLAVIVMALFLGVGKVMDFLEPAPQQHVPTWDERYAAAVRSTFSMQQPIASQLGPALLTLIGSKEAIRAGWQVDKVDCKTVGRCEVTYLRNGGTFLDFDKEATPEMRPISFDPDGRHLTAQGPRVPSVAVLKPSQAKEWPTLGHLTELLQTPAQRLSVKSFELDSHGYKVTLEPAKPILPGPVPPGRHGSIVSAGDWQIEGFRWQMPLLERLPPNMTLTSLVTTLQTQAGKDGEAGIKFVAKGKYYVLN